MFLEYDNIENNANGLSVLAVMASPRKSGYTAKLLGSLLREFPKGTKMVMQSAVVQDMGWCSCYICLPCIENWLEESGQVDVEDELEGE